MVGSLAGGEEMRRGSPGQRRAAVAMLPSHHPWEEEAQQRGESSELRRRL